MYAEEDKQPGALARQRAPASREQLAAGLGRRGADGFLKAAAAGGVYSCCEARLLCNSAGRGQRGGAAATRGSCKTHATRPAGRAAPRLAMAQGWLVVATSQRNCDLCRRSRQRRRPYNCAVAADIQWQMSCQPGGSYRRRRSGRESVLVPGRICTARELQLGSSELDGTLASARPSSLSPPSGPDIRPGLSCFVVF